MNALDEKTIREKLAALAGWDFDSQAKRISKTFRFVDFYRTMAFVNGVALVADSLDHHPDLEVGYSQCVVRFSTHDAGGVTQKDIDSAAAVNALPTPK